MPEQKYVRTGYLNSDFEIFRITDSRKKEFSFHYHDFHKVLIFLGGNVSYTIEGRQYELEPYDIILVRAGKIHRPVIHDESSYERIIAYISDSFFDNYRDRDTDLSECFDLGDDRHSDLIRLKNISASPLFGCINSLSAAFDNKDYAAQLLRKVRFIEFMILLDRSVMNEEMIFTEASVQNRTVQKILDYINMNLNDDINIDSISGELYLNRSYVMHLFKKTTGCTIGNYITGKRLFQAKKLICDGMPVTEACYRSGFKNYSDFYHAFRKKYEFLPKDSKDII